MTPLQLVGAVAAEVMRVHGRSPNAVASPICEQPFFQWRELKRAPLTIPTSTEPVAVERDVYLVRWVRAWGSQPHQQEGLFQLEGEGPWQRWWVWFDAVRVEGRGIHKGPPVASWEVGGDG